MSRSLPSSTPALAVADPAFDRFTRLVRDLLHVPVALVTLVSAEQQVFPGALGLPEPWQTARCTPLSHSFCQHVVTSGQRLVVTDAREHPLLADNLAIPDLNVIAYAGIPLTDRDGTVIGSLCAIDSQPRIWDDQSLATLTDLAAACSEVLQLRIERNEADAYRSRLELAIGASEVGTFDWDLTGDGMSWDAPLIAMFGYTAVDFEPTTPSFYRRLHPQDADRVTQAITTAIDTGGDFTAEYRIVLPGGDTRWIHARGRVIVDGRDRPVRFIGAAYDTTDVHAGDTRTTRLLNAMPSGFLSMDRQWRFTLLNPAAEALLGYTLPEVAGRTIWDVFPDTVGNEFEHTYRAAVASGVPHTLHAYYPAPLDAWFDILCWPSPDGLSLFFTDVTDRTRADQRAEAAAARLALLARVADALVQEPGTDDVLSALPALLVPGLGDACVLTVLGEDGRARDVSCWHHDPDLLEDLREYRRLRLVDLPANTPTAQVLSTGQLQHVSAEQMAALPMNPRARQHLDALGPVRAVVLPLRSQGVTRGAMTLFIGADVPRDAEDEAISVDVADRIGSAIATDRLAQARTQLAEDLQRSLLTAPPAPDHAQIVVRYLPATEAARVGGDWYDAFLQLDGATMIVIGDVVGHDTAAAAAMGQIRGLLRGIATYSGAGPADVLRGLDTSMQVLQVNTLATAAVARFEQTADEVERGVTRMIWSNAGHPEPLVLHADGSHQVLAAHRAELLLGVDPNASRSEQVTVLDRGATVLLYTDGLIERRDSDLDDGLTRLIDAVAELRETTLDELCDGIVERLVDGRPDDDVALVAVRLHRQDQPRPPEAGPTDIPDAVPEPTHPAQ